MAEEPTLFQCIFWTRLHRDSDAEGYCELGIDCDATLKCPRGIEGEKELIRCNKVLEEREATNE